MIRRIVIVAVVLALLALAWWLWRSTGGVSHRELKSAVIVESLTVQAKVDARCDALEHRLDRIEHKLDRLIEMATPKLPDGMKSVE